LNIKSLTQRRHQKFVNKCHINSISIYQSEELKYLRQTAQDYVDCKRLDIKRIVEHACQEENERIALSHDFDED